MFSNYGARLYDPVIGRFITPDTIIPDVYDPQSLNRYSYCRNNPLIYTDPTGHVWGGGYTDKSPSEDKGASGGFSSSWGGGYTDKTPSESKAITGFFNAQIDKNVGKMGKISKAAVAIPLGLKATLEAPTLLGKIAVAVISGITIGYLAYKEMKEKAEEESNEEEKRSNPLRGEPGSTRTLDTKEGNPKQDRTFKEDTYPEKDIDYDHPHKGIQPHAHDWGRPEDGSPPTDEDRGEGRDLTGDETTNLRDKKD